MDETLYEGIPVGKLNPTQDPEFPTGPELGADSGGQLVAPVNLGALPRGNVTAPTSIGSSSTGQLLPPGIPYYPPAEFAMMAIGGANGNIILRGVEAGPSFVTVASPDIVPGFEGSNLIYSVDFAPGGAYLAAACNSAPRLYLYKRSVNAFAKLPDPASLPGGVPAGGARFSPDGLLLAVSANSGLHLYQRVGDSFTKLADPANGRGGASCAWNQSGTYLASCSGQEPPYLYSRAGNELTKISNPDTPLPIRANSMAFSPLSDLLICAHNGAPYISVSSISGGVHTRHADPATVPTSTARAVAINPAGTLAVVAVESAPFLLIYSISGTTLTLQPPPTVLPAATCVSAAFSKDGSFLVVGADSTLFYAVNGVTLSPLASPPTVVEPATSTAFS